MKPEHVEQSAKTLSLKESFLAIVAGLIVATATTLLLPGFESKVQLLLGQIAFVAPLLIYLRIKRYPFRSAVRLRGVRWGALAVSLLLGLVAAVLTDEIDRVVTRFMPLPQELQAFTKEMVRFDSVEQAVMVFLAVVLCASLFEEILFRGVLQSAMEKRLDVSNAILLTAFIFSFFHPPQWIIQVLLLGVLLGYLTWRSRSIVPSIVVHACNNLMAVLFNNFPGQDWTWYNWHDHVNPPVLAVAACLLFYGVKLFNHLSPAASHPAQDDSDSFAGTA